MPMPQKVNLAEKLSLVSEHFQPRIVGAVGDMHVKIVKLRGDFVWHHHENEDEMFLVVRGSFRMELRNGTVELREGEFIVVPRGMEHRPVADEEVSVLLFEPATTLNTGNVRNDRTVAQPERI